MKCQNNDYIYFGTAWFFKGLVNNNDFSTLSSLDYKGKDLRTTFDRRYGWVKNQESFIVVASFTNGPSIEVIINSEYEDKKGISPEIGELQEWLINETRLYAYILGQFPPLIRKNVDTLWIHKGHHLYGGGNRNILIHLDQTKEYILKGVLEQMLLHEAAHNSLDFNWKGEIDKDIWLEAAGKDGKYISKYAMDNPMREDITETIVPYLAIRYRPIRFSIDELNKAEKYITNRITILDNYELSFPEENSEFLKYII